MLNVVTKKFPSGEESWFVSWYVLSILCYEKLCPIVLLVVCGFTFICYFCYLFLFVLFVNGSFSRLCGNTTGHSILFIFI